MYVKGIKKIMKSFIIESTKRELLFADLNGKYHNSVKNERILKKFSLNDWLNLPQHISEENIFS